jgi:hypothetical protein
MSGQPGATSPLADWLRGRRITVAEFAGSLGIPVKTAEDWVYRNKRPSPKNAARVFSFTGLLQYAPRQAESDSKNAARQSRVEAHIRISPEPAGRASVEVYRLIQQLDKLAYGPRASRDVFRRQINGGDIGYLRSVLAALLDEEQLEDWKRMSSYRPRFGGLP